MKNFYQRHLTKNHNNTLFSNKKGHKKTPLSNILLDITQRGFRSHNYLMSTITQSCSFHTITHF